MYFCCLPEDDVTRGLLPPLIIYPRVGKSPKDRNIHHLKIKTAKSGPRLLTDVLPGAQGSRGDVTKSNRLNQSGTQLHGQPYGAVNHSPPPGTQLHHQSYAAKNQNPQIGSRLQNHQPQGQTYASEKLDQHGARSQNLQTGTQPYGARSQADNIKQILTCGSIVESDLQQEALLGRGNGGLVYKAIHRPTQRVMAVKVIELDVEIEVQRKILSELEILYRCHSCAIIGFYGAYFVENHISICTEYMDAGSLDKYGRVPEHVLGFMAVQIITGLLYMWNEKILHRDIKPSNMLVSQAGDVKLCDFGVSTQLVESIAQTYVGTNAYMALAMGEFPFKEPYQLCRSILEETNPVLPAGQFSPELVDFVGRCMQKVAVQRITQAELMTHPYMQRYSKDGTSVISSWVKTQMPHAQPF